MKIGIVPMSGKPVHAGHYGLIMLASKECDEVHLYVSTTDRGIISGEAMKKIWLTEIIPTLPPNVEVTLGGSPIRNAWADVGQASEEGSQDTYLMYSDVVDAAANFPDAAFQRYAANLFTNGQIMRRPVERTSTVNISGTKMRQFIQDDDKESFLRYLPNKINGEKVWQILTQHVPGRHRQLTSEAQPGSFVKNDSLKLTVGQLRSLIKETIAKSIHQL